MKSIPDIIKEVSPYYQKKGEPETEHFLFYDSPAETLEPLYFWILDLMNDVGLSTEKLVDNFSSSPGSGHFAELGQRATIMQQQASQIMGNINTVLRSVLNLIYDLKDFKIRLQTYNDLQSKEPNKKESALLTLKQIWMDKVDIQKGNSSIKAMALGQAGFQTLIDAFLIAKDEENADKIDLNDRVKRIVKSRIEEFNIWLKQSEEELRKRYELERNYLRSQVNSLKIYSRWAKPYLKAAFALEQKEQGRKADFVTTFNTVLLELTLFGKAKFNMPKDYKNLEKTRNYYKCVLVDFYFRGIPQRVANQSHFAFGGRAEVTFRAYSLNEDELKKFYKELNKSDLADALMLAEGATEESLKTIEEEINSFLNEKDEEGKEEKSEDTSNVFKALVGGYDKKEKKDDKKEKSEDDDKPVKPDNWTEKTHMRPGAAAEAKQQAFDLFDIYKKAHQMASYT